MKTSHGVAPRKLLPARPRAGGELPVPSRRIRACHLAIADHDIHSSIEIRRSSSSSLTPSRLRRRGHSRLDAPPSASSAGRVAPVGRGPWPADRDHRKDRPAVIHRGGLTALSSTGASTTSCSPRGPASGRVPLGGMSPSLAPASTRDPYRNIPSRALQRELNASSFLLPNRFECKYCSAPRPGVPPQQR